MPGGSSWNRMLIPCTLLIITNFPVSNRRSDLLWISRPYSVLISFKKEDLVLYGEMAILVTADYPILYDDITERMPFMIGFNIPGFMLLDVLCLEFEKYTSPYPNSFEIQKTENLPQPTFPTRGYVPERWAEDDVKWSLLASRTIIDGVSLSGIVARDHLRGRNWPLGSDYWSILTKKSHWYWMFKINVSI